MLILEGPDGSGKSTLAQQIQVNFPHIDIVHSNGPRDKETINKEMTQYLNNYRVPRIYDRISAISEPVYGPILRGRSLIEDNFSYVNFIAKKEIMVIYCSPVTYKKTQFRDEEDPDHVNAVLTNEAAIRQAYQTFMYCIPNVIRYSYDSLGYGQWGLLMRSIHYYFRWIESQRGGVV